MTINLNFFHTCVYPPEGNFICGMQADYRIIGERITLMVCREHLMQTIHSILDSDETDIVMIRKLHGE